MGWRNRSERGDTLVEVLLSMAILSLVIVGGSTLMNFGLLSAQNAVEHTQVRNLVAAQSELLHYLRDTAQTGGTDAVSTIWHETLLKESNGYVTTAQPSPITACVPNAAGKSAFFLTSAFNGDDVQPTITVENYPADVGSDPRQYAIPGRGLWIEGVKGVGTPAYVDFHIRACWLGIGTGATEQQFNTVVRLFIQ